MKEIESISIIVTLIFSSMGIVQFIYSLIKATINKGILWRQTKSITLKRMIIEQKKLKIDEFLIKETIDEYKSAVLKETKGVKCGYKSYLYLKKKGVFEVFDVSKVNIALKYSKGEGKKIKFKVDRLSLAFGRLMLLVSIMFIFTGIMQFTLSVLSEDFEKIDFLIKIVPSLFVVIFGFYFMSFNYSPTLYARNIDKFLNKK